MKTLYSNFSATNKRRGRNRQELSVFPDISKSFEKSQQNNTYKASKRNESFSPRSTYSKKKFASALNKLSVGNRFTGATEGN